MSVPGTAAYPLGICRGLRWHLVLPGSILAWVGALTMGNAPFIFTGYGLSVFALLVLGMLLEPKEAMVALVVGNTIGLGMGIATQSMFTFVAVAGMIIRPLQLALFIKARPRFGLLVASGMAVGAGTLVATYVGTVIFGGNGGMAAFSFMDFMYVLPALLILRLHDLKGGGPLSRVGIIAAFLGTFLIFFSASAFFEPAGIFAGLFLLSFAAWIYLSPGHTLARRALSRKRSVATTALVLALAVVSLAANPTVSSMNVKALLPAVGDPPAWSQHEWYQTITNTECQPGNVAGGGTFSSGVWHPERLRMLSTCVSAIGMVVAVTPSIGPATDGDYSFDIALQPAYAYLLTTGNYAFESGYLHVEIVPNHQGALNTSAITPGEKVQVEGAWVIDTDHGWGAEIHPAWTVTVLAA